MKKYNLLSVSAVFLLTLHINAFGQTTSPPIYQDDDSAAPSDLAVEKTPPKPAPKPPASPASKTPATATTTTTTTATIPAPVKPPAGTQPTTAPAPASTTTTTTTTAPIPTTGPTTVPTTPSTPAPVTAPAAVQAPAATATTTVTTPAPTTPPSMPSNSVTNSATTPAQTTTQTTTTVTAPVPTPMPTPTPVTNTGSAFPSGLQAAPALPPPPPPPPAPMAQTPVPADGTTKKDAGMDIGTAMVVSFDKYDENSLSSQDTVDVFKLYGRGGEGIGFILIPKNSLMQLSITLLGENGELLSQTQAPQPGAPISFQTSPLDKNRTIYIQVKDMNLSPTAPAYELRPYSLELKPVAAPVGAAPAIAATTTMPAATPPAPAMPAATATANEPAIPSAQNTATGEATIEANAAIPAKESAPAPKAKKAKSQGSGKTTLFTILGILILGGLGAALVIIRKKRAKIAEEE